MSSLQTRVPLHPALRRPLPGAAAHRVPAADRAIADRAIADRAIADRAVADGRAAGRPGTAVVDCEDGCHYCQGPETD